jgi:nondiscriminating aspartyl-tRNA synthetase
MKSDRTHYIEDVNVGMKGQEVIIGGWVEDLRKMGKMTFLTLRDVTGITQIILTDDVMKSTDDISRQSVVRVTGKIQDTRARDFECEIKADEINVLAHVGHLLPIDPIGRLESHIDNRLNSRALDMRNQKTASIFKIRHHVLASLRKTLLEEKFYEITTPKIIGSASEGGANLFSLDYFGKQAYLAQSPQLYKEQMTIGLERVFEIAAYYRAEKSHTVRHLSEFTMVDIEAAFMDYTKVMDILEKLVINTFKYVSENCEAEQKIIENKITVPDEAFKKITYSEALEELNQKDAKLEFGDDLLDSHLRLVGENHPGFYFLTDWPIKLKPFYIMEKEDNPELSESFDLQYGYLELSSGGTRLHDQEKIKMRLSEQNLDPAQFSEHLQVFDWGMPPHAGWGLGLERLLTVITGIDNVREVILYPRDPERLKP